MQLVQLYKAGLAIRPNTPIDIGKVTPAYPTAPYGTQMQSTHDLIL
jgi:hypothetical protein